jgi:hypothetical protein
MEKGAGKVNMTTYLPLLVLNLLLDILNGVRRLDLKGDGLASQSFDENLHGSRVNKKKNESRPQDQEVRPCCPTRAARADWRVPERRGAPEIAVPVISWFWTW